MQQNVAIVQRWQGWPGIFAIHHVVFWGHETNLIWLYLAIPIWIQCLMSTTLVGIDILLIDYQFCFKLFLGAWYHKPVQGARRPQTCIAGGPHHCTREAGANTTNLWGAHKNHQTHKGSQPANCFFFIILQTLWSDLAKLELKGIDSMTFTDQACSCHVVFASAGASGKPQVLHDKTNTNNEQIRFDIVKLESHRCVNKHMVYY